MMLHTVINAYAMGGSAPAIDAVIAVQEFATPTSTGYLDITTADLGGRTPKAVLFLMARHAPANDPNASTQAVIAVGAMGTGGIAYAHTSSEHNVASTDCYRNQASNANPAAVAVINVRSPGDNSTEIQGFGGDGGSAGFITNGIRINFSIVAAFSSRMIAIFFAGDDLQEKVGNTGSLGTSATTTDVTSVGFEPDLVLLFGTNGNAGETGGAFLGMSFGAALADGTQKNINWQEADGAAASTPYQIIRTAKSITQLNATSITYSAVVNDFDASGFSVVTDASSGSDAYHYLALNFGGLGVSLFDFDTPTSTGNQSYTTPGFEPQFALAAISGLESRDATPVSSTDNQGFFSICAIGNESWAMAARIDAGADPTSTANIVSNHALRGGDGTTIAGTLASLSSFDANGLTLNYSAALGAAKKGFMLCVEAP